MRALLSKEPCRKSPSRNMKTNRYIGSKSVLFEVAIGQSLMFSEVERFRQLGLV